MEGDSEAQNPVKILIVWSGALVPGYGRFFLELARYMTVRALGPRRWVHGSVRQEAAALPAGPGCEVLPAAFWSLGGSRYLVPALPLHLWRFRPRYLYLMEELDRPTFAWHALLAKAAWPGVRVVGYSLQNIREPGYHRWHHGLALRINRLLADRVIAASGEAAEILRSHGYRRAVGTVPLWGSESVYRPPLPEERTRIAEKRAALGIPEDAVVLLYSGSLAEAKGLLLLAEALPRFPRLRLVSAGTGPLEPLLRGRLGAQWIHLGALRGEELAAFYRLGDYVILPSVTTASWKEQIGRSLIEGVLSGCIALGSDSGHIPELTRVPEAGFRQGDAGSLADLLGRLPFPDAPRIREIQRRNVEERFTAAATARATWAFLADEPGRITPAARPGGWAPLRDDALGSLP
jgi:glycosyltransferase involved in cell wall biosynthesis